MESVAQKKDIAKMIDEFANNVTYVAHQLALGESKSKIERDKIKEYSIGDPIFTESFELVHQKRESTSISYGAIFAMIPVWNEGVPIDKYLKISLADSLRLLSNEEKNLIQDAAVLEGPQSKYLIFTLKRE